VRLVGISIALVSVPEHIVRNLLWNPAPLGALIVRLEEDCPMKSLITIIAAGLMAGSFAISADAGTKQSGMDGVKAQCQAQAKKKYSAIHFLKRRDYVKNCMHQRA
jgi:hypothetical protein